ncbi:hypothetical protein [Pedobacter sp. MC2016-24]|uniref:hypothetical protein n=1 Tax=Pedobacter sp. MC2016-24 TaxID=2780090 RepID=UPI001882546E|nr:hypothetical protein [Pedobacter sp. MC2016-24]MBE9599072.1 hypothetical protein [Pedobacter sp. MC2016-24]
MNKIKITFRQTFRQALLAILVLFTAANAFAQQNLTNAKKQSTAPPPAIYAHLELDNDNGWENGERRADVMVRFYSDYALTTPVSVTDIGVGFAWSYYDYTTDIYQYEQGSSSQTGSGTEFLLRANALLESFYGESYYRLIYPSPSPYIIVP